MLPASGASGRRFAGRARRLGVIAIAQALSELAKTYRAGLLCGELPRIAGRAAQEAVGYRRS